LKGTVTNKKKKQFHSKLTQTTARKKKRWTQVKEGNVPDKKKKRYKKKKTPTRGTKAKLVLAIETLSH